MCVFDSMTQCVSNVCIHIPEKLFELCCCNKLFTTVECRIIQGVRKWNVFFGSAPVEKLFNILTGSDII